VTIRRVNMGETEARAHMPKSKTWRMRAMCVCVFSSLIMSLCLCFQQPSVDGLPHNSTPTTPFRPPQTQITPTAPRGPRTRIPFRSCSPFCCPVKRVSLVRDWWVTPSFDVKSLEHACSSTKDRERERRGKTEERAA